MKLSKETLEILNSFRTINSSIVIYPGNSIKTKAEDSRMFAEAVTEETFEREFAFYDIKGFLDAYNILGEPDLIFGEDDYVVLKDERTEIKYYFSEPSLITSPSPNVDFQLPSKDVCFQLDQTHFNRMMRMTTFDSDRTSWIVDMIGDNNELTLKVYNRKDPTKPSYSTVVGATENTFCFRSYLDTYCFISGNYDIVISKTHNFLEARNNRRNLRYVLALSPESFFED